MNRNRKSEIRDTMQTLKRCITTLENIRIDEADYYENIPSNLEGSERAEESEYALDLLDTALDNLSLGVEFLEEIVEGEVI